MKITYYEYLLSIKDDWKLDLVNIQDGFSQCENFKPLNNVQVLDNENAKETYLIRAKGYKEFIMKGGE